MPNDVISHDEVIIPGSSSYHFFQSLLALHSRFFNTNKLTAKDYCLGYKTKLSNFFNSDPEVQPLFDKERYSFSKLALNFSLMTLCLGVAGFASWLYWDDSQRAANRFLIQLGTFFIWFSFLVRYCCFLINLFLNTEVELLLGAMIYAIFNQSKSDRILMGAPNLVLLLLIVPFIAFFAELPFIKLALISAKTSDAKTVDIISAIASLSSYCLGALVVAEGTQLALLSKTIDNSARTFNSHDKKLLREARDIIAKSMSNRIEVMLTEYKMNNFTTLDEIAEILKYLKDKNNTSKDVTTSDLRLLFRKLGCFDKKPPILQTVSPVYESRQKKIIAFMKKHFACNKQNLKAKTNLCINSGITTAAADTVGNDVITGFFASYDIFQSTFDKIFFGLWVAFFTLLASGGFTHAAIKSLLAPKETNIAKIIYPRAYIIFAALLIFIGCFSGGPSGLEGYLAFMRMLPQITFLVLMSEVLGYLGGVASNIPFSLNCLKDFLLFFALQFGRHREKQLVNLILSIYSLQETISHTKYSQTRNLLKHGVFGNMDELGIPKETQELINSEHPSDMTYFYQSIP